MQHGIFISAHIFFHFESNFYSHTVSQTLGNWGEIASWLGAHAEARIELPHLFGSANAIWSQKSRHTVRDHWKSLKENRTRMAQYRRLYGSYEIDAIELANGHGEEDEVIIDEVSTQDSQSSQSVQRSLPGGAGKGQNVAPSKGQPGTSTGQNVAAGKGQLGTRAGQNVAAGKEKAGTNTGHSVVAGKGQAGANTSMGRKVAAGQSASVVQTSKRPNPSAGQRAVSSAASKEQSASTSRKAGAASSEQSSEPSASASNSSTAHDTISFAAVHNTRSRSASIQLRTASTTTNPSASAASSALTRTKR